MKTPGADIRAALQAEQTQKIQRIPLGDIECDPGQIRNLNLGYDDAAREDIANLARTIKTHGLIQPIVVYALPGGKYRIICGERRYHALVYAEVYLDLYRLVDAIVYPSRPDPTVIADLQFTENVHRANLSLHEIITWTLNRFADFECKAARDIRVSDITGIMSIKKSTAYLYLKIWKTAETERTPWLAILKANPTSLKKFAAVVDTPPPDPADEAVGADIFEPIQNHPDEQNQRAEAAERPDASGFPLGRCQNPAAIQALIRKNTPDRVWRSVFAEVDFSQPRAAAAAFREFIAWWEAKS